MKTSPSSTACARGMTSYPSITASSARSGSTSVTITRAPIPRARMATPRPQADHPGGRLLRATDDPRQQIAPLLVDRRYQVGAVVQRDLRPDLEGLLDVPVIGIAVFSFDGEDADPLLHQRRGH